MADQTPPPTGSSLGDPGNNGTATAAGTPAQSQPQAQPQAGWAGGTGGGWGGAVTNAGQGGQGNQGQFQPYPDEDVHNPMSDPRWQGPRGWEGQGVQAPAPTTFAPAQPQAQMPGQAPPPQFPGDGLAKMNMRYSDTGGQGGI